MSRLREEEGISSQDEDDDDAAWKGWDEDSSDSNSESEGWVDVEDGDDDLVISDSEDEGNNKIKEGTISNANSGETKISQLATTKVATFGLINRLDTHNRVLLDSNASRLYSPQ